MIDILKRILRPFSYRIEARYYNLMGLLFPSKISDSKKIPIIINNRNRITFLLELIEALKKRGYFNIYIIDNNSSYPPLLEYYKTCPYPIFRLDKNVGYMALWKTDIYKFFIKDYYVYTDSDVVPIEECPDDFMEFFIQTLKMNINAEKVGFSLKIDDLPNSFLEKEKVIEWEKKYYEIKAGDMLYEATIDTTFALYRPFMKKEVTHIHLSYRTAFPYSARHLPWYIDSLNLSEEEKYYKQNASTLTHWTKLNK
jgi:hypothetical protein